jgi:hypothetical protein
VRNMPPLVPHRKDAAHKTVYWSNWVYRYPMSGTNHCFNPREDQ